MATAMNTGTPFLTGQGIYDFSFFYTHSWKAIDIDSVSLLQDGVRISEDNHKGFSGNIKTDITYRTSVPGWNPEASYTLRAKIRGSGGVLSYGQIHLNRVSDCVAHSFIQSLELCEGDSVRIGSNTYLAPGTFIDTLAAYGGCDSIITTQLSVHPLPPVFEITGQTSLSESDTLLYAVPANSEISYQWFVENGEVLSYPSGTAAEIQWGSTGSGNIYVVSENQYGCSGDTASLRVDITSTVISRLPAKNLSVYPNPASGELCVEVTGIPDILKIIIVSSNGQVIWQKEMDTGLSSYSERIQLSNYSPGTYLIKIISGSGFSTGTIILK